MPRKDDKITQYAIYLIVTDNELKAQSTSLRGGISDVAI